MCRNLRRKHRTSVANSATLATMPAIQSDANQAQKLRKEYTALAPIYDLRWSAYLDASLRLTLRTVGDLPAERLLDVACGTGRLLELIAKRPNVSELVGIDKVPAMLDVARQRLGQRATLLECDAVQLPFGDESFQLITSTSALHYFEDADAILREMRRVISPDGNLVITDWCRDFFSMSMLNCVLPWTHHAHVHTYSSIELQQCLAHAGFAIKSTIRTKVDWFWGMMSIHATPIGDAKN